MSRPPSHALAERCIDRRTPYHGQRVEHPTHTQTIVPPNDCVATAALFAGIQGVMGFAQASQELHTLLLDSA
eukprot:6060711-Lingulodinium_polyedra.AAC.1